ncbi:Replication factor A protein 1 [Glycine soja]
MELAVLSNFMARILDKIKSIDGSREMLKLAVRVTNLWFVGTPNKSEQAEMIIVDSEGDQIHVVCKADQLKSWKADLKENSTYVMHNFKVVKNDSQFRVCEHEYKLVFIRVTVVREADLHELSFKEFKFVEFGNVVAGNFVASLLVDIIGIVDQVLFRHVSSKNTRVAFRTKDLSGEVLSCTLWENYCMQFLAYLNECGNDGPIVIILTHARIKDAQGSYLALVSNLFKASKLLINEHVLEIQEFRERYFGYRLFVLRKIVMDNHSWCYPACIQCHRKTDIQTGPFTCGCGKDNDQPVLRILYLTGMYIGRYRVEVMVSQNNDSSKFLLCDRECAELIGEIVEVNRVKIEDGDVDLNASPQALDRLLGYVLAFKVRIQSKFRNVVVLRYSNELDLINVVLDMLANTEACSKIDASNVDCNNAMHPEFAGFPLTPKKRLSSDEVDDELGSSQISPAQLSSNKLTRHSDKTIFNMQNYQHAKRSNSAKARINRKRIMQQKRHPHAQSSSQPTINCTSEYDKSVNSESTQGSGSNFLTAYEDCQSPTNQPVINTEGYSDLGDQLMQCKYCNAQIQYSRIQGHIVSSLTHMLDEHNSHAKSFRIVRDRLGNDEANNIKLQLIVARGKDGHVYNMPNVPEIAALIVGNFHPSSKRDIIVETQNGELQRIHELHPSYLPLQYRLLFPYGEDGYRADILHRSTSSNKKRKSNEAETLLHSRKLFQQFIVEGYTMVESERLSYIRNNQKKLRVDKYCSLQNSLDTGIAKGLTKGKRVILPSTFVGSPRYMDQLYFDGMAICSHVGFPNLFITLTSNPNWPEIHRLLSPLNLKPTDRPDIINDDTLRNLTLIEIEQLLHINQRSLKDYPTMPYPQDSNLTSYLQNSLLLYYYQEAELHIPDLRFLYQFLKTQHAISTRDPISRIVEPDKVNSAKELKILIHDNKKKSMNSTTNVVFKEMKYPIIRPPSIMQFKAAFHNDQTPNYPESVQLRYNGATYQIQLQQHRGRFFLADGLTDFRADLKIYESIIINFFVCDDISIFDVHFTPPLDQQTCAKPLLHSRQHISTEEITQCILGAPHPLEISFHAAKHLNECGNHMTILRKHGPPLQWKVVTLDVSIKDKSIVRPWYKFLKENDFHHGDEVSFYYRTHEKIWEIVIRKQRKWE